MKRSLLISLWTAILLCLAGTMTARASSTLVTFSVDMATNIADGTFDPPPPEGTGSDVVYARGTFDGWASPGLALVQEGTSSIWTNTYNDTSDANGDVVTYLYDINGNDEGTADYDNRADYLPATSGASLILPTQFYGDIGPGLSPTVTFQVDMSEQIELGQFNPSSDTLVVAGSFNGWSANPGVEYTLTNNPSILVTNLNFDPPNGLVESNVYTLTVPITVNSAISGLPCTNSLEEWKYVIDPAANWENPGPTTADGNGNRFFFVNTNQTLPLVYFGDQAYSPLAEVTFNVDMSAVVRYGSNYVPNSMSVWGTFNGWASGVPLTNNPAAANSNIYSGATSMAEGTSIIYQFRYTNSYLGGWVYDYAEDGGPSYFNNNNYRRTITLPVTSTLLNSNLPTVFFDDLAFNDYLPTATAVLFSVDMNNAVGTDNHVFAPGTDAVYINGSFTGATESDPNNGDAQSWYPWENSGNPVAVNSAFEMIQEGSSTIYTNTLVLPAGTPVAVCYQYGMDPDSFNGGPLDDEAPTANVHFRVVRSTQMDPYVMATDTFTNMPYQEPFFSTGNIAGIGNLSGGDLTIGTASAGATPVTWLGRPGAHLQAATNLTAGAWLDLWATDGTNWTTGYGSTNGFVSETNWPSQGSATYFRLVKP